LESEQFRVRFELELGLNLKMLMLVQAKASEISGLIPPASCRLRMLLLLAVDVFCSFNYAWHLELDVYSLVACMAVSSNVVTL